VNRYDYKKLFAPPRRRGNGWTVADDEAFLDWLDDYFGGADALIDDEIGITARPKGPGDVPYRDPEDES